VNQAGVTTQRMKYPAGIHVTGFDGVALIVPLA